MRDSGLTAFGQRSLKLTKQYVNKGLAGLEATFPDLYKSVAGFSAPYVKLLGDLCQNAKNACLRLYDSIANYVSKTAPEVTMTVRLRQKQKITLQHEAKIVGFFLLDDNILTFFF